MKIRHFYIRRRDIPTYFVLNIYKSFSLCETSEIICTAEIRYVKATKTLVSNLMLNNLIIISAFTKIN